MLKNSIGLVFLIGFIVAGCKEAPPPVQSTISTVFHSDPLMDEIMAHIESDAISSPIPEKIKAAAINGVLGTLDPYCQYMPPETYAQFTDSAHGQFGGLGLEVLFNQGILQVISPIDDTPGAKSGIESGDLITHIDGVNIQSLPVTDVFKKLHGPVGTSVTLLIERGLQKSFSVKIERAIVTVNPVKYHIYQNIAVIRISYFNEKTGEKLDDAIRRIHKESGAHLHGIILDLRNNPGGILEQSVAVASAFLNGGDVVHVKYRDPSRNRTHPVKGKDSFPNLPLIVLINRGSASASEIVAGALQDHQRALIVGTQSVGKGSVQSLFKLANNQGGLKLTIAHFYTPKGRKIQEQGIIPDIEIEAQSSLLSKDPQFLKELFSPHDTQLMHAFNMIKGIHLFKKTAKEAAA